MTLELIMALGRAVKVIVWVIFLPVRALMYALMLVTYLLVTAVIVGVLYGLWSSGVRPW